MNQDLLRTIMLYHTVITVHKISDLYLYKDFAKRFTEYFMEYHKLHQWTGDDMAAAIPDTVIPISIPMFHGLVISDSNESNMALRKWIQVTLPVSFSSGYVEDSIINSSGAFSFVNVNAGPQSLDGFLRGRRYDMVFIVESDSFQIHSDMLSILSTITHDGDASRIIVIKNKD